MLLDQNTVRRRERRDGIACFTAHEPEPSTVAHLFTPIHPDYEAARAMYEASVEERTKSLGFFA